MPEKITVETSKKYDVVVGNGILSGICDYAPESLRPRKVMTVTDDNVAKLYLDEIENILKKNGIETYHFVFGHGERNKTLSTVGKILEQLAEEKFTRTDAICALGGGITGDVAGFAASCYMRGIQYVQIPTTLLAAVDSSVGGKTAVNLSKGKNLAGHFYQPALTVCDTSLLDSLSDAEFANGLAEVIKYGMIYDEETFSELERFADMNELRNSGIVEKIILKCVRLKAAVVAKDEFDKGERMLLNFGHTVGHAIEKASSYRINHGYAVAAGMSIITKAAEKEGICAEGTYARLTDLLSKYVLPVQTKISSEKIAGYAVLDKKNSGGKINAILPETTGKCFIKSMTADEFGVLLKKGLE